MSRALIPGLAERPRLLAAIRWLVLLTAVWTLILWLSGGGLDVRLGGIRISSRTLWRPLLLCTLALLTHVASIGARATAVAFTDIFRVPARLRFLLRPEIGAALIAVATVAQGVYFNSGVCGGADSFGYLSQAELWLKGSLVTPLAPAAAVPWPDAVRTFAPLGYTPALNHAAAMVPVYPIGFPLLLAVAKLVAGWRAMFWVVPLCGGLLVFTTFAIGSRVDSRRVGLAASCLVATSPAVVYMLVQPMSDVPAAAFWALATLCAFGETMLSAGLAGLCASIALMIRPNLLPLGIVMGLWVLLASPGGSNALRRRLARAACFALGALPGLVAVGVVNSSLYGSPTKSGYGDLSVLFSLSNVVTNAKHYVSWLMETQTPLVCFGLLALCIPALRWWKTREARREGLLLALIAAAVMGIYCFYRLFDAWWFLRFVLPAWPAIFVGTALLLARLTNALPIGGRQVFAIAVIFLSINAVVVSIDASHGSYTIGIGERRYAAVAKIVAERTEPTSLILSMQHSGSLRYYGGRWTMRYDWIDPQWLDRAVAWLGARGVHTYLAVEPWELDAFEQRFAGTKTIERVRGEPLVYLRSAKVGLYDLVNPVVGQGEVIDDVLLTKADLVQRPLTVLPIGK